MRKKKDVSRVRPIVSFFKHPLKNSYYVNAVALMTCLKALPDHYKCSNIFSPPQMLPNLLQTYETLATVYGTETEFLTYAADIKEMYSNLPTSSTLFVFLLLI